MTSFNEIWQIWNPSTDVMSAVIGIIMSILALALPIVQGTVSDRLAKYNNKHILRMFMRERTYKALLSTIVLLIFCLILTFFFSQDENGNLSMGSKVISLFVLAMGIISIVIFYYFFKRCNEYAVNTDEVVLQFCEQQLRDMSSYESPSYEKHLELIEMCGKVMEQKIQTGNASNIDRVAKIMEDSIIRVLDSVKIGTQDQYSIIWNISKQYYMIMFKLWRTCYRSSEDTACRLIISYNMVVRHAINKKVNDQNSFQPLLLMYQRMASEIEPTDNKTPYASSSPWKWYFDIVFDETFNLRRLQYANLFLLSVMQKIIDNDARYAFIGYVSHIVDSWYAKNDLSYTYPDDLNAETEIRLEMYNCIIRSDLAGLLCKTRKLNEHSLDVERIRITIIRQYKYNNLQVLTMIMGAYCLFRKKDEMLRDLLQYNQPMDSEARFGNKDIIPDDFNKLVEWYKHSYEYVAPYVFSWPDHHDVRNGFKRFVVFLMYWMAFKGKDCTIDIPTSGRNMQFYENLVISMDRLKSEIDEMGNEVQRILNINNVEGKDNLLQAIDTAKEQADEQKRKVQEEQQLDDSKVEKFKEEIMSGLNMSIWKKCLGSCKNNSTSTRAFNIALKKHIEKSFLALDDNGMYFGFPQSFSKDLVDQIDFKVEKGIIALSKMHPFKGFQISKYDYNDKIFNFDSNAVIIFINCFHIYEILYRDTGFVWDNTGETCGKTSNGATVISLGDSYLKKSRLIVINKNEFSKLSITINKKDIQITDLNNDESKLNEVLHYYDRNISPKGKERIKDALKKEVLVEITGKCQYYMNPSTEILYLDDIK